MREPDVQTSPITVQERLLELYDSACRARLPGGTSTKEFHKLLDFTKSFEDPRAFCWTPEEPCARKLGEYTVWLTMMGVLNADSIVRVPKQPLILSEALCQYSRLNREFITCSLEECLDILDSLQNFFALMLRYPMVPHLAMDTKECPECYFEAEITQDTWEEVRKTISCYHYTLRHESFTVGAHDKDLIAQNLSDKNASASCTIDEHSEMVRAGTCDSLFLVSPEQNGEREAALAHGHPRPVKFLEQLDSLKRRDEIIKQKILGKEIFHKVQMLTRTLEELQAPRYISSYPLRCLYQYYGSLNRSRARAQLLSQCNLCTHPDMLRDAQLKVQDLRMNLRSTASTGTNDTLLSYICMAVISPVRRYTQRYNVVAERIVLFKHLISSGFPIETASSLVKHIQDTNKVSMISVFLEKGVELQLRKTTQPTHYNIKIASLIWLFSHLTAYCTLRNLPHGYIRMGDSPEEFTCDGIYVFDQDYVGFKLSSGLQRGSDGSNTGTSGNSTAPDQQSSAYLPFSQILELLAMRDITKDRIC